MAKKIKGAKKQAKVERPLKAQNLKPAPVEEEPQAPSPVVQQAGGELTTGKLIIGAIGLIIVLVVGYFLLGLGGSGSVRFPAFAHSNEATPKSLSSIRNLSGNAATQSLAVLAQESLAGANQLTIEYSGSVTAQYSVVSINSPISIFNSKYAGNQKFAVNVSNVEAFGPAEVYYLNNTNGTFSCTNLNSTAVSDGNYGSVLLESHPVTCSKSSSLAGLDLEKIADFNFSQINQDGVQLSYNQVYQSSFEGNPCTYISGSMTVPGSGSTGGLFQECISDVYYVPLSFSLYASGSRGSISMSVNETYISNSSSLSEIDSMPGEVV